eukprot:TRINITY_DN2142_c0_g1_i1.p3 TRINITY_DN2142_c0_g1~~TRINITY_DN2142_c0_g1_i1.p3  ORF type:complete len:126 (-),score=37.68 TRINITY_DN2142_c0_g1_i1:713-1090(-)
MCIRDRYMGFQMKKEARPVNKAVLEKKNRIAKILMDKGLKIHEAHVAEKRVEICRADDLIEKLEKCSKQILAVLGEGQQEDKKVSVMSIGQRLVKEGVLTKLVRASESDQQKWPKKAIALPKPKF